MQGHLAVVEYLCNASADVNKADDDGCTPLYAAAEKVSRERTVCMLHKYAMSNNLKD